LSVLWSASSITGVIISVVERKLRELDRSQNQEERETFERVAKPVTPERMRP